MTRIVRMALSIFFIVLAMLLGAVWMRNVNWLPWATPASAWKLSDRGSIESSMGVIVAQYYSPGYRRPMSVDMDFWHADNNAQAEGWRMQGFPINVFKYLDKSEGRWMVTFPIWCPLLIFAGFSYLLARPAISWRFSLRALFIATTLLAVTLGLAASLVALEAMPQ